jgi:hypothetical protein
MAYTHIRFLAYRVPTVAKEFPSPGIPLGVSIYGIDQGAVAPPAGPDAIPPAIPPALVGAFNNLPQQTQDQINRMFAVMAEGELYLSAPGMDNNNTLKVFMVPEFYFRPSNPAASNAYSYAEYRTIKNVLRQTINGDPRFRHWLVIPGTIIWRGQPGEKWWRKIQGRPVYFNSCVYISPKGTQKPDSETIEKYNSSPIDGIPFVGPPPGRRESPDNRLPFTYLSQARRRKHIFKVGGIKFGLEICLEHGDSLVKTTLAAWRVGNPVNRHNKQIHVQLITAGGMPLDYDSVATRARGFVFRLDGFSIPDENDITVYNDMDVEKIDHYLGETAVEDPLFNFNEQNFDFQIGPPAHRLYNPNPAFGNPGYWVPRVQRLTICGAVQI